MFKISTKGAMLCAALPLGLLISGCTNGIGAAGLKKVAAGNWPAAKVDFHRDYANHPNHPIAVFNMGATHAHEGDNNKAAMFFSETVQTGRGYVPDLTLEPAVGATIAEHACSRLHRDNRLDVNCGDQLVAVVTPEPEASEAMAAQATVEPKQDRN